MLLSVFASAVFHGAEDQKGTLYLHGHAGGDDPLERRLPLYADAAVAVGLPLASCVPVGHDAASGGVLSFYPGLSGGEKQPRQGLLDRVLPADVHRQLRDGLLCSAAGGGDHRG